MNKNSKIYIAGHGGMAGSAIYRLFIKKGFKNIITATHEELDLINYVKTGKFIKKYKPDLVILAAARVGGIKANMTYPAEFLYENLMIQNNVIHHSYLNNVKKIVFLGSNCVYPRECSQPIKEESLLTGPFEPTNEGYAIAKLAGLRMVQYYSKEYGMDGLNVMPCNLYGPNDSFDPEHSHVLSAMVKRFVDAANQNLKEVVVWGTGKATREFLHVDDLAEAILFLLQNYNSSEIVNVGTGRETSIKELVTIVAKEAGYKGKIIWDTTKPDGMPRKFLDITKLRIIGFAPKISLEEGVKEHVKYYKSI